ncbi:MAG: paraquat-inducible protein A [Myxococcota bacterium]|nr:paraquat-inducible protein A [Myxococcota bacterium]
MAEITICTYCDEVHARPRLTRGGRARCTTCHSTLYHADGDLGAMLAVTVTATVAFAVANAFPLITLTASGRQTGATLWSAIAASYDRDLPFVAVALTATLIVTPIAELLMLLWVLVPLAAGVRPPGFPLVMRAMHAMRPWRMIPVFLLGLAVAIVKLSGLATTVPGWGMFGVVVMTIALASLASFDREVLWRRADELAR